MSRSQIKAISRYQALRQEVTSLSPAMAAAMLSGLTNQPLVTGQYTDGEGGTCPLLAANRAGAPLAQQTNFPSTWDLFCGLKSSRQARPATTHEIHILTLLLQARVMPVEEIMPSLAPQTKPRFMAPRPRRIQPAIDWQGELSQLLSRAERLASSA